MQDGAREMWDRTREGMQTLRDEGVLGRWYEGIDRYHLLERLAGALQIETVFSWPGLGGAIFESVNRRDFPVLQGAFLLIAVSVILANLIADLTYSYLDPRVQSES